MTQSVKPPAGAVDAHRGYLWDSALGSWTFKPVSGALTLVIFQETDGKAHAPTELTFSRENAADLRIGLPGTDHHLLLKGWYTDDSWRLQKIQYNTGTASALMNPTASWIRLSELLPLGPRLDQLMQDAPGEQVGRRKQADDEHGTAAPRMPGVKGTHGDDGDNTIYTGTGRDRIYAGAGNDRIVVRHRQQDDRAPDNKYISGGIGTDTVDYSFAFEKPVGIKASLKEKVVTWGTSGHDRLVNIENLVGTSSDDRLEGSAKDNILDGGRGNDVYLVTRGGGNDTIVDHDETAGNVDTLLFGPGIRREDLRVRKSGDDVVIDVLDQDRRVDTTVTVRQGVRNESTIERFKLDDGTAYTWHEKNGLQPIVEDEMADEPSFTRVPSDGRATTYRGTDGKDLIQAVAKYDKVLAGAGDDTIMVHHTDAPGLSGNKEIRGDAGNDTVDYRGAFGNRGGGIVVRLSEGSVWWGDGGRDRLSGVENVSGTDDADRFEGDGNNNLMTGRKGNDIYVVALGDGRDQILDEDDTEGNRDTIVFGPGIRLDNLYKYTEGPDLVIQVMREDGQVDTRVTIQNGTQSGFAIERFVLADNTEFQLDALKTPPFSVL